jgi:hypothetical protein
MTEEVRPPDHPVVPRPKRSIVAIIVAVFSVLVVGGYSALAFTQRELGSEPERDEVPTSVRSSPGGYRSFHFWHSGYHGGK